jgi:hypothetical protein
VDLYVVPVGTGNVTNGGIVDVYHEGQPAMTGTRFDIRARALAGGAGIERTVQFEFDGQPVGRRKISSAAGQQSEMEFLVNLDREGFHRGRVSFLNPDGLVHDDVRHFTLNVTRQIKVLVLEDEPSSRGSNSESFFLRRALVPPGGAGADALFGIERASPIGLTDLTPERADVVVVASPERINDAAWGLLERYVARGGGVLVFAGPEATQDSWSTPAARSLTGVEIGQVVEAPEQYSFRMRPVQESHPLVHGLEAANADVGEMQLQQILQVRPLAGAQEVFSFGRERPAVITSEAGGRTAVITSPPDNRWGEFATTANPRRDPFLPLLHESMFYLAGRVATGLSAYRVGDPVPLRYPESEWPTLVRVTPPGGEPETLSTEGREGRVTWHKTGRPGYYRVEFERRDTRWEEGFAVNTPPEESDLRRTSLRDIQQREVISAGTVALLEDSTEIDWNVGGAGGGLPEYTPLLALAVLLAFTAESFLANRFYKGRADEGSGEEASDG